jgi:alanyl-tRNA synthetase
MTNKIYYASQYLTQTEAIVAAIMENNGIILNQTIAFPESGGQESDYGTLMYCVNGQQRSVGFKNVRQVNGRLIYLDNFPVIPVETDIIHFLETEDADLCVGMKVQVGIDVQRREQLTVSHTATHIGLMAIENLYPKLYDAIRGCHIKEDSSRLDFAIESKITDSELSSIQEYANELVSKDYPITMYAHSEESEARYWQCLDKVYPCGGTHLLSTKNIGRMEIRKKNLGKGTQRIIFSFPEAVIDVGKYHT